MRFIRSLTIDAILLLAIFFLVERPALAYVDPGSSLALYQGASSFVLGVLFICRKRFRGLFSRLKKGRTHTDAGSGDA